MIIDQYGGLYPNPEFAFIIKKIAITYGDIDVKSFEREQDEIRLKRESRARKRITALKMSHTRLSIFPLNMPIG